MDEVHEFIPEGGVGGKYAPEVERAVRHWRNEDVGFVLTSQRPALVKKNVLALTDYLVIYGRPGRTISRQSKRSSRTCQE